MASTIELSISGIPDGARDVVLNKMDGSPVASESVTFASEKATLTLPNVNASTRLKGYTHDGLSTILRSAFLEAATTGHKAYAISHASYDKATLRVPVTLAASSVFSFNMQGITSGTTDTRIINPSGGAGVSYNTSNNTLTVKTDNTNEFDFIVPELASSGEHFVYIDMTAADVTLYVNSTSKGAVVGVCDGITVTELGEDATVYNVSLSNQASYTMVSETIGEANEYEVITSDVAGLTYDNLQVTPATLLTGLSYEDTRGTCHLEHKSYAELESLYETSYAGGHPYELSTYANNEGDFFSFKLNAFITFYINMHKMSSDDKWLVTLKATMEHILNNTDAEREGRGEITLTALEDPAVATNYYQAPYPYMLNGTPVPGWSSFDGSSGGRLRTQVLQDGLVLSALCRAAYYIKENSLSTYYTIADTALAHARVVITSHDNSFREDMTANGDTVRGSYLYPKTDGTTSLNSKPLAYNHSAGMFIAIAICNHYVADAANMDKLDRFLDFTRTTRVEHQFDTGGRYEWAYLHFTQANKEDLNHGSYSLIMFQWLNKLAVGNVTDAEMLQYTNSVLYTRGRYITENAEDVDGAGTLSTSDKFNVGEMSYLHEYNSDMLNMARNLTAQGYIANYALYYSGVSELLVHLPASNR